MLTVLLFTIKQRCGFGVSFNWGSNLLLATDVRGAKGLEPSYVNINSSTKEHKQSDHGAHKSVNDNIKILG